MVAFGLYALIHVLQNLVALAGMNRLAALPMPAVLTQWGASKTRYKSDPLKTVRFWDYSLVSYAAQEY
jgi:hypothetical protein